MAERKFTLKFVNGGKPFAFKKWTVAKHRTALMAAAKECADLSSAEQDEMLRYYIIREGLMELDSSLDRDEVLSTLKQMHPENVLALFNGAYFAGMEDIYFHESRQTKKKTKSQKST